MLTWLKQKELGQEIKKKQNKKEKSKEMKMKILKLW